MYRTITFFGHPFQGILLEKTYRSRSKRVRLPRNPNNASTAGLDSSAFARHYLRNHYYFLFLQVLRCFSSLGTLPYPIYSGKNSRHIDKRVSPFGHLRIKACLAAPRSFSQPTASFIAHFSLGIRHIRYVTYRFFILQQSPLTNRCKI